MLKRINKKPNLSLHFDHAYQKSITHLQTMQKINVNDNVDIVMPIYDLLEYSDNIFMTSESLQNHYRDEVYDHANKKNAACIKITKQ